MDAQHKHVHARGGTEDVCTYASHAEGRSRRRRLVGEESPMVEASGPANSERGLEQLV